MAKYFISGSAVCDHVSSDATSKDLIKKGTRFFSSGKHKRECVVIDIYKTYNNNNELVRVEYLQENDFCGQKIKSLVPATSILLRLISY